MPSSDDHLAPQPSSGTLVDRTMQAILDYLYGEKLAVGDALPGENRFAEQLGVSRTVVREAFKSLAAMHILQLANGRRARVAPFDGAIINQMLTHALRTAQLNAPQLWDARQALEYRIVELAALRRTAQDVTELQGLVAAMQQAVNDPATMTELDIRFHTTLARISGNPLFPALITALAGTIRETNPLVWRQRQSADTRTAVVAAHAKLAESIADGDPQAAQQALKAHFDLAFRDLIAAGLH